MSGSMTDLSDLDVHAGGVRHRLRLSYSYMSVTVAFDGQTNERQREALAYDHPYPRDGSLCLLHGLAHSQLRIVGNLIHQQGALLVR